MYFTLLGNRVEALLKGGPYVVVRARGEDSGVAYRVEVSAVYENLLYDVVAVAEQVDGP